MSAGENFDLDLNVIDLPTAGELMVDDDGAVVVAGNEPEKVQFTEELRDGDFYKDDDGMIKAYSSTKKTKETQKTEKGKEKENEIEGQVAAEIKTSKEEKKPSSEGTEQSPHSPYAAVLKEDGILPDLDIEEFSKLSAEEQSVMLRDAYKERIDKGIEDFIENLPVQVKDIVEVLKATGKNIPLMEIIQNRSEQIELNNITDKDIEEDDNLQKQLVYQHLKESTSFSDEKIKKELTRLEATNALVEEAKEAHVSLKVIRDNYDKQLKVQAQKDKEAYDQHRTKVVNEINDFIDKSEELFPGRKISADQKKELKKFMLEPVAYDKNKQPVSKAMEVRSKNPILFDARLNHYIQLGLFNEKVDTTKIEEAGKTKAIKNLANILEKNSSFQPAAKHEEVKTKKNEDVADSIDTFLTMK